MADPAEDVLQQFITAEGWRLTGKNSSREHRLRAWFVWSRADALKASLSGGALFTRVKNDHDKLLEYLKTKFGPGPKYDSGPLVPVRSGTGPDGNPPHLDLLDLARRRVDDPTDLSDTSKPRIAQILARARRFTSDRVRRALEIVWRSAAIEASALWTAAGLDLNSVAMDEILNRRLRAVERITLNIASQNSMLNLHDPDEIPPSKWQFGASSSQDWFDGLRVRVFEYPYAPGYAPVTQQDIDTGTWLDQTDGAGGGAFEHNSRNVGTRVQVGGTNTPVTAGTGWRFAAREQPHWEASGGDPILNRIDFVPKTALLSDGQAATAVDNVFDISSTAADGKPIRADFWNRAWMWCEQAISALSVEALLFGLRRRLGVSAANAKFASLAARRPQVDVAFDFQQPSVTTTVQVPFVALDQHLDPLIPGQQPLGNGLLMSSQETNPAGVSFDPHFSNTLESKDQLQVADWVRANNAGIYYHVARRGAWGAENALITDVQPKVSQGDRGALNFESIKIQGHGTKEHRYNDLLDYMAGVMDSAMRQLWRVIVSNRKLDPNFSLIILNRPDHPSPTAVVQADRFLIIQWTPFAELNNIVFPEPVGGASTLQSGPWWFVMHRKIFHGATAEDVLQGYPKTIGGSASNPNAVSKIPGIAVLHTLTAPEGTFNIDPNTFWNDHVLFPMFEPAVFSETNARDAWGPYFNKKRQGSAVATALVPTPLDHNMVPGILRRSSASSILAVKPKVSATLT